MESVNKLSIPNSLYDFILFCECAKKDWINEDSSVKTQIKGDGSLMNYINWNVGYSNNPNDSDGNTKFGVTENTWKSFVKNNPNKGYNDDLNSMNQQGWKDVIEHYWGENMSSAAYAKNYACAYALFDMKWLGFNGLTYVLNELKKNANIQNYNFITNGSVYRKIADATHAYVDPMFAYETIRKARYTYLYNSSTPENNNKVHRVGWLNRSVLSFSPYGLFVIISGNTGLEYNSTLTEWERVMNNWSIDWSKGNKKGYVRIHDWGASQQYIASVLNIQNGTGTNSNTYLAVNSTTSSTTSSSTTSSSTTYSGAGGVSQLGSYSNSQTTNSQTTNSQILNAKSILNKINESQKVKELHSTLVTEAQKIKINIIECSKFYTPDKTPQAFT